MTLLAPARASDRPELLSLLKACSLPVEDLPASLDDFAVARDHGQLVGAMGLEVQGKQALLRSAAVASSHRGRGVASQLWQAILQRAQSAGLERLYLLTTTAQPMFTRWGWRALPREDAPALVRGSAQFRSLCPSSAALMQFDVLRPQATAGHPGPRIAG